MGLFEFFDKMLREGQRAQLKREEIRKNGYAPIFLRRSDFIKYLRDMEKYVISTGIIVVEMGGEKHRVGILTKGILDPKCIFVFDDREFSSLDNLIECSPLRSIFEQVSILGIESGLPGDEYLVERDIRSELVWREFLKEQGLLHVLQ